MSANVLNCWFLISLAFSFISSCGAFRIPGSDWELSCVILLVFWSFKLLCNIQVITAMRRRPSFLAPFPRKVSCLVHSDCYSQIPCIIIWIAMSENVTSDMCECVCKVMIQTRLQFRAVWSEFSLDAFGIAKDAKFEITKTRLFKYIENFTFKNWKFSDKKTLIIFIILLKT